MKENKISKRSLSYLYLLSRLLNLMNAHLFAKTKKHLESLNSEELHDFLQKDCKEPGYEGLSNAQSIYRKMLESDTYLLDEKDEANRLLDDLKLTFGNELYDAIYSVLTAQHKERTEQIRLGGPPALYHGSIEKIDKFEPRFNTCQFGLHSKRMICASDSLYKNAIYSFRMPSRSDGQKATSIITSPVELPSGEERRFVIQSELKDRGYMYELPSETFIPVVRLDGYFNNEWISFSAVSPRKVETKTLKEIEEQYKLLCFTFPNVEKEEEFLKELKELKKEFERDGYQAVETLVQRGIIVPATKNTKDLLNNLQNKKNTSPSHLYGNGGIDR